MSLNEIKGFAKNTPVTIKSYNDFVSDLQSMGITDSNVEDFSELAFIEIGNTLERCEVEVDKMKYDKLSYPTIHSDDFFKHQFYFNASHHNVLRMTYDDVSKTAKGDPTKVAYRFSSEETKTGKPIRGRYNGKIFDAENANELRSFLSRFIQNNILINPNTKFIVHCQMGASRSAAIGYYINHILGNNLSKYMDDHTKEDGTPQFRLRGHDIKKSTGKRAPRYMNSNTLEILGKDDGLKSGWYKQQIQDYANERNLYNESIGGSVKKSGIMPFRINENGEVEFLLGLPGEPTEPHSRRPGFYGVWNIFKGHTDGQDVRTAAIREFEEETGLSSSLIRDDNFYDLGVVGSLQVYGLDVTGCEINPNSLRSNMVTDYKDYEPFPEIGSYGWFKFPFSVTVRKSAVSAAQKIMSLIKEKMNSINESKIKRIIHKIVTESIEEIQGSHVSHAKFDTFSNDSFGSGEGKAPAHGYGTYVAIDPQGNPRYFLQSIRGDHHDENGNAQSYYYDIEIPDITESNYLYENYPISQIPNQLNAIKKHLYEIGIDLDSNPYYSDNISCKRLLQLLGALMSDERYSKYRTIGNSPKSAASGLMVSCGIVGMIYYSKKEKICAVIFDPAQVKVINRTDMKDVIGDIQPSNDDDRKRVQKKFIDSDFYKQRQKKYEQNPFDTKKYYSDSKYVNKDDDKRLKDEISKYDKKINPKKK